MAEPRTSWIRPLATAAFVALAAWWWVRTAWVTDDAFISMRVARNALAGDGLVWNVGERVQAFTNPLWVLLLVGVGGIVGSLPAAAYGLSLGCWLVAVGTAFGWLARRSVRAALAWAGLVGSSATLVHHGASGLEGPLLQLCVVMCYVAAGSSHRRGPDVALVAASFACLTRLDAVVSLAVPMAVVCTDVWRRAGPTDAARAGLLGVSPVVAWLGFATFYYGFPLPNTFLAKVATVDAAVAPSGLAYVVASAVWDPIMPAVLLAASATLVASRGGTALDRAWMTGAAAHVVYVWRVGGDYMLGRFLVVPVLVGALIWTDRGLSRVERPSTWHAGAAALAVAIALGSGLVPRAPMVDAWRGDAPADGAPVLHFQGDGPQFVDAQRLSHRATGWRAWIPQRASAPLAARMGPRPVIVEDGVGAAGWLADPNTYVVDLAGLGDPLLSRLPGRPGVPGHHGRAIPHGYLDSVARDTNALADPRLRDFYEDVRRVTRAPVFDPHRIWSVARLLRRPRFETVDARARVGWRSASLQDGALLSWCLDLDASELSRKPVGHGSDQVDALHGAHACGARLTGLTGDTCELAVSGGMTWAWVAGVGDTRLAEDRLTVPGDPAALSVVPVEVASEATWLWLKPDAVGAIGSVTCGDRNHVPASSGQPSTAPRSQGP